MENSENIKNKLICQCRNSIKLRILEYVNSLDKPVDLHKLIDLQYEKTKEDNKNIEIDDDFLKTYIRSIISEMVDSKLINLLKLEINDSIFYVKIDMEKINQNLKEMTEKLNSAEVKNSTEIISNYNPSSNPNLNLNCNTDLNKSIDKNKSTGNTLNNSNIENEKNLVEKNPNLIIQENKITKESLINEFIQLKNKLEKIKKENKTKKLHNEIHRYNEIKDIGQELLGYIAGHKGKRIKEYYEDLGISDDDTK